MAQNHKDWLDKGRIYPEKLRNTPTALLLYHTPDPNYPIPGTRPKKSKYLWVHDTCIIALKPNLTVVEAGSFIWVKGKGWVANMQLNAKEAAKAFKIKNGQVLKNKTYCYPKNTRYGNTLYAGDALWYVIAKDENNKNYKGVGIIETEAELQTTKTKK